MLVFNALSTLIRTFFYFRRSKLGIKLKRNGNQFRGCGEWILALVGFSLAFPSAIRLINAAKPIYLGFQKLFSRVRHHFLKGNRGVIVVFGEPTEGNRQIGDRIKNGCFNGAWTIAVLVIYPVFESKLTVMSINEEVAKMEYDRLAKEIVAIQKEASQLAQWAVISIAAICTAMVTSEEASPYLSKLKWLPLAIVLVFGYRVVAQFGRLVDIAKYLKSEYEGKFLREGLRINGWETHLSGPSEHWYSWTRWSVGLFWVLLLIGAVVVINVF